MAKQIVERNQAFVEKVLQENEQLLYEYEAVKQQLAEARYTINNLKRDTIKEMEPKIAQLLEEHKINLKKQEEALNLKFEDEKKNILQNAEKQRLELITQNAQMEEHCHQKLLKLKERALNREKEIKDALNLKIKAANDKIEAAKKQAKREEELARTEWQKYMIEKLRAEYKAKAEEDMERAKKKQEKILNDVVSRLEIDAHEENQQLKSKLDKETQEHRMVEQRLRQKIEKLKSQLDDKRSAEIRDKDQLEAKCNELNRRVSELQNKLSQCKCIQYQQQIEQLCTNAKNYEKKIEELEKKIEEKKDFDSLQYQKALNESKEKDNKIRELENAIKSQAEKHRAELTLISDRVKKTIELKDQKIQQLIEQFESLGNHNSSF